MCVGSCAAFYIFEEEREQGIGKKKGGDWNRRPELVLFRRQLEEIHASLENELQGELHDPGVMRVCRGEEIARAERSPDMVELRVVEGIVGLPAKFDGGRLPDGETLEEAHIEIGTVGTVQSVPANISERQSLRRSKRAGIEEQWTQAA